MTKRSSRLLIKDFEKVTSVHMSPEACTNVLNLPFECDISVRRKGVERLSLVVGNVKIICEHITYMI